MSIRAPFLGFLNDLSRLDEGSVVYSPKPGYREKVIQLINDLLSSGKCSSAQASTLRGKLQSLDSGLLGKVCRGATVALIARQYYESTVVITQHLRFALVYLRHILSSQPPC